jgi:hypothetical protein
MFRLQRRSFMMLAAMTCGVLASVPLLFLIYGALGAAVSGMILIFAGALLPLPLMLLLKKLDLLPKVENQAPVSQDRRDER